MPGSADYGLLYFTLADGGSGGDPFNMAQNLGLPYGKMLRIDPCAVQQWWVSENAAAVDQSEERRRGAP
jgi:hypothetical protein